MTKKPKTDDIWSGKLKIEKSEGGHYQVYIPEYRLTLDIQKLGRGKSGSNVTITGWRKGRLYFTFTRFEP